MSDKIIFIGGGGSSATGVTAASTFATDNVLLRSDGTSRGSQATGITVDDNNRLSGVAAITMAATAGTTGTTNALGVGGKLYFTPFTNGTTTTVTLPATPASGDNFTLFALASNGTSTFTMSGNVRRFGGDTTDVTLITPGPAGDTKVYVEYINSRWYYSDTIYSTSLVGKVTLTQPATSATLTIPDGTTATTPPSTGTLGYINVPQNSQSAAYTTVLADQGKEIYHPVGDANARTFTIDSNANVAYPIGTVLLFTNMSANNVTIAITSDTLYWFGTGGTGSRTLAQYGTAAARKLTTTTWGISGTNVT